MSLRKVLTYDSLFEGFALPYAQNEHAVKTWFLNTIDDTVTDEFLKSDAFADWAYRLHACIDHQGQYNLPMMLKHWAGSSGLSYSAWDMHSDKWIYQLIKVCDNAHHYPLANGLIINKWYQRKSPYQDELHHLYQQKPLHYGQVIAHLDSIWLDMGSILMDRLQSTPDVLHILSPRANAALLLRGISLEHPVTLETTHALGELAQHHTSCWNPIWEPSTLAKFVEAHPRFSSPLSYAWWSSTLRPSAIQGFYPALEGLDVNSPAWWLILVTCYVDHAALDAKTAPTVEYLSTKHPELWLQHLSILSMASQLGIGPLAGQELVFIQQHGLGQKNSMFNGGSLDLCEDFTA